MHNDIYNEIDSGDLLCFNDSLNNWRISLMTDSYIKNLDPTEGKSWGSWIRHFPSVHNAYWTEEDVAGPRKGHVLTKRFNHNCGLNADHSHNISALWPLSYCER